MRSTKEVANTLVNYCRQGDFESAIKELYDPNIVSIEPDGTPQKETVGLEAVIKKGEMFNSMVEAFHGMEVSDPVVADNFFSCTMSMDVTLKGVPRNKMEEVCVYQVNDGKIVREEFFFTPVNPG